MVELYSPVLFDEFTRQVSQREGRLVEAGAEARARGELPDRPITFVLDEVPVNIRANGGPSRVAYTVFTVAEVFYVPGRHPGDSMLRENRLRLARAFPGPGTQDAWWLVLAELQTVPDVLVNDFAQSIQVAAGEFYKHDLPVWIPSLFHFDRGMRRMFAKVPEYNELVGNELVPC